MVIGAAAGAHYVHAMAEAYGCRSFCIPIMHRASFCPGWMGCSNWARSSSKNRKTLFSSHMLDLSEETLEENISICETYLKRMSRIGMTLEIELE